MEQEPDMPNRALKSAHNQASASRVQQMGLILDHLVDALGGDPSAQIRKALILLDIDENSGTSQSGVGERLGLNKVTLSRDIDWLYDHGCILRQAGAGDGRTVQLATCGYSKKNLGLALDYFGNDHKNLQIFLNGIINLFTSDKPTLRDAKLLVTAADLGEAGRQELFSRAYAGPQTTNVRALDSLIEQGLLKRTDDDVNG
jgi:DNA-binding MarR family transcriptional regulator